MLLAATLFAAFCFLGTWQLQRRAWKLELIATVEQQLQRAPVPAPGPASWPDILTHSAYLPVQVKGRFLHEKEMRVQAMTTHGSGYWVLTPMQTQAGFYVLINRGFVDQQRQEPASRKVGQTPGPVEVSGLLRLSEPGGRFLRPNDPERNLWYSRDVAAMGELLKLPEGQLAPYFIDANDAENSGGWPVGGLTVVRFRNTHLTYAITWYALALLTLVGLWIFWRHQEQRD